MAKKKDKDKRKFKFNALERLTLMQLLSGEASIVHAKIMADFRDSIGFTEEEQKFYDFREEDGRSIWNHPEKTKSFEVGRTVKKLVKKNLKVLDKQGKIRSPHISLWEKFIGKIEIDEDED